MDTANGPIEVAAQTVFGCDGGGSGVRRALVNRGHCAETVDWLDHGYKELLFTPGADEMAGHALHIWPRGTHMLMGLANLDATFTGTIYLAHEGSGPSFRSLDSVDAATALFTDHYPDAIPLLESGWAQALVDAPDGYLGTVRCAPWNYQDRALLVGDAAHAIVPFFGQGLNCGFEDCAVLWELTADNPSLQDVFSRFFEARKTNADAIADMALENFVEMRDRVGDQDFLLRKGIERRIEQELPHMYRSRYATVMYSYNPYRDAFDAGAIQKKILVELADGVSSPHEVDLDRARTLIQERLSPFYEERGVDLSF